MEPITLYTSTGNQQVDEILRGTIGILETLFPNRVRAYYLHGSFIDQHAVPTSDIDFCVIPKGSFTTEEREKVQRIMHSCSLFSPFMVEMMVLDEDFLLQKGHFRIKSASRLLWGEDLRTSMPEQTLDQYLRMYTRIPVIYFTQMLRSTEPARFPLDYPQATGEFYGYDQQLLPPKGEPRQNIKKLVSGVCWAASVLVALQTGKTVEGKRAGVQLYRELINDEWSSFIEEMYELGNRQWHYLVPQNSQERETLRALCARTLAFENFYLRQYRQYLLAELRKDDENKLAAVESLRSLVFPDDEEILLALQGLAESPQKDLRRAVADALHKAETASKVLTHFADLRH